MQVAVPLLGNTSVLGWAVYNIVEDLADSLGAEARKCCSSGKRSGNALPVGQLAAA